MSRSDNAFQLAVGVARWLGGVKESMGEGYARLTAHEMQHFNQLCAL